MFEFILIAWVWMLAGAIAVFTYQERLTSDEDMLSTLALIVVWPWWLHYGERKPETRRKNDMMLSPIRVETRHHNRRNDRG